MALCSAWVPVEVLQFCTCLCVFDEVEGHDALKRALEELAECVDLSMCIDSLASCGVVDWACKEDMLHCLGWCPTGVEMDVCAASPRPDSLTLRGSVELAQTLLKGHLMLQDNYRLYTDIESTC